MWEELQAVAAKLPELIAILRRGQTQYGSAKLVAAATSVETGKLWLADFLATSAPPVPPGPPPNPGPLPGPPPPPPVDTPEVIRPGDPRHPGSGR